MTIPLNLLILETLLGYTFLYKPLLLKVVIYPLYLSIPSTPLY